MSGFGTKKPGGDKALQLTFPAVYSEVYASAHIPKHYYPERQLVPEHFPVGTDLQAYWHQQKMADAHRRVMNAVKDTEASRYRYIHSHANYYEIPKPVLSQRIYANPSNGNQADIYSARVVPGLRGGVLRTAQGQRFGRSRLRDRIAQLNAIDQAEAGFQLGEAVSSSVAPVAVSEAPSDKSTIEMTTTLQSIADALEAQKYDRLLMTDMGKMLKMLFRWSATADRESLEDVLQYMDLMLSDVYSAEANDVAVAEEGEDAQGALSNLQNVGTSLKLAREYVARMLAQVNLSIPERKKLSANLVKTLGFTKLSSKYSSPEELRTLAKSRARAQDAEAGIETERMPGNASAFDAYDDNVFPSLHSSRVVIGRENADLVREFYRRQQSARFDPMPRAEFGDRAGAYFGEEMPEGGVPPVRNAFRRMAQDVPRLEVEEQADAQAEAPRAQAPAQPDWLRQAFRNAHTMNDLRDIARRLGEAGINIRIRDGTTYSNARANFRRRFGL